MTSTSTSTAALDNRANRFLPQDLLDTSLQSGVLARHYIQALLKQPFFLIFTLIQPVLYLLMFSELFSGMATLDGFGDQSYITYLTPGVVLMTALFSGGWTGMGAIEGHERGTLTYLLTTPISRGGIVLAQVARLAASTTLQTIIVVGVGIARGARLAGGLQGLLVLVYSAVALSLILGFASISLALLLRRQEGVVAAVNLMVLPLAFSASLYVPREQMPTWLRAIATVNPADWAATAARAALATDPEWALVGSRVAFLSAVVALGGWLTTKALASYQYSH